MTGANRHFAPGREFSLIETLFDDAHFSKDAEGLGDDAYLLRLPAGPGAEATVWAVSTDASVEGVHYRLDWTSPAAALEKALLSNLSDLNAMGATTALAFLSLGAPREWGQGEIAGLGAALKAAEEAFGFRIAGGDTVRTTAGGFFNFTVMGPLPGKPLLRSNARPGHGIFVSGKLGDSAAGLALLSRGERLGPGSPHGRFFDAHFRPEPPLALGPFLATLPGPVAAIDISDGLSSELWHLARQSGCRMLVEWGKLPYDQSLIAASRQFGESGEGAFAKSEGAFAKSEGSWREWVLGGGEGYQLLFTGEFGAEELAAMGAITEVTRIGTVGEGRGVAIADEAGALSELMAGGWSH